ncbi:MAG: ATP-dependent DNA helicase [Thermoanaerobaculia bacterium]
MTSSPTPPEIAPSIDAAFPSLNPSQREIIGHLSGPLLVIAGPGSGKTFSLALRTLNLLLLGRATPAEIVVCTFTEKAAHELRDRISAVARKAGYTGDLTTLRVGTIHGLCHRILTEHRHRTPLGNGFQTLDELSRLLFLNDHKDEILGEVAVPPFFGRWSSKWTALRKLALYFDKMTEECLDPNPLVASGQPFPEALAGAYGRYRAALLATNRVDFAHQQRLVYDLLLDPEARSRVAGSFRYVMVDEYQDTNYVQEQLLLQLSGDGANLAVVGDEDQSLYRFRGATVRNILEFPARVPASKQVRLTTNYRSHPAIIAAYDRWMATADWSNRSGPPFRFPKAIKPSPDTPRPDYPAVLAVWGRDEADEARRVADLVAFLHAEGVVDDLSQVALLLHSVRDAHSGRYLEAFEARGIPAYCPRARTYFDNEEVRLVVGALAILFGFHGAGRGTVSPTLQPFTAYVDACLVDLARACGRSPKLTETLRALTDEIDTLEEGGSLDTRPADYLYRLLALEPFPTFLVNQNRARNLAVFSQLLNTFQAYYHFNIVTFGNRQALRFRLFSSFLRLLHEDGLNDWEDPEEPFPKGHVQVLTIHQSKGLEFPVVIAGSLTASISTQKDVDRDLGAFYHRLPYEPAARITSFDRMRLHYVAFTRAERVLVLTAPGPPKPHFAPIWQGLPQWPYVQKELLAAQSFVLKERIPVKRRFSFTGDLRVYETCPRQYQFFRAWDFTPSRSAVIFFGLLVHQTIEEVHRLVLDGKADTLTEECIRDLFARTHDILCLQDVRPIGPAARENALTQVLRYVRENRDLMSRVIETEVDVSVEKDEYILTGKVDLLLGGDGKLELLDFKTSPRPVGSPFLLRAYEMQLATYAHIIEKRHGRRVDRLLLYWTAEPTRAEALMELPNRPGLADDAGRHFDDVVRRIRAREFGVPVPPESTICKECDLRDYCVAAGTLLPARGR